MSAAHGQGPPEKERPGGDQAARPIQQISKTTPNNRKGITGRDARHRGGLRAAAMIEAASHDDRRIGVIFDEAEADGAHGTKWLTTQLAYAGAFFAGQDGVEYLTFRILSEHIWDYE